MKNMPITGNSARYLKLSLICLTLMVLTIVFSGNLIAQDSVSNIAVDSSMAMTQDTAKVKAEPALGIIDTIANNKVLSYTLAGLAFILIVGLTFLSSIRKSKNKNTGNTHHRSGGGHHHHHHKHRHH